MPNQILNTARGPCTRISDVDSAQLSRQNPIRLGHDPLSIVNGRHAVDEQYTLLIIRLNVTPHTYSSMIVQCCYVIIIHIVHLAVGFDPHEVLFLKLIYLPPQLIHRLATL